MSRVTHGQTVFSGGEFSPLMLGRWDHELWDVSLAALVGWIPRPQGPLEASPGFEFIGHAAGPCRLFTLEPYVDQGYVIEASAELMRFYTNDQRLEIASLPVEVETPYSYEQTLELDYHADKDVLYLFHGSFIPQQLVRTSATSFVLEDFLPINGPFEDRNRDESLTVAASVTIGTATLTASADLFEAGDVGGLFEIEFTDMSAIKVWEPGMTTTAGGYCQWGGNVYQTSVTGRTGSFAPRHFSGTEYDGLGGTDINSKGPYGVPWEFMHNGYGQLLITAFVDAQNVTAEVQTPLASTAAQWRWRFGAFSERRGWPEYGSIHDERMVLGKGDTRYLSQVGLLDDYSRFNEFGDIGDDQAIISALKNGNNIRWLHSSTELFTGSAAQESTLRQSSAAKGIAPGNTRNIVHSSRGSAAVKPIDYDGRPIFVQRNGKKLLMMNNGDYDRYVPEDLTRYADHIGNSRIIELAKQREPLSLLWGVRADGLLFGTILMPDESVLGFFRRPLGGELLARSITTVTSPDGAREDLWCAAQKGDDWLIMKMGSIRNAGEIDINAVMCDAAVSYDGAETDTLSLPHLVGETVEVVTDGTWRGSCVVPVGGDVVLSEPFTKGMAGLPFPAYFEMLPLEAGGDNGPAQMKMGRQGRNYIRVQGSLGLRVTVDKMAVIDVENQYGNTPMDAPLPFDTKDIVLDMVGAHNRLNDMRIDRIAPFQSTVLAVVRTVEKAQR